MTKPNAGTSLLLAYYGDDFTGSADVMESLARAGLKTVLFLKPPTQAQLARFTGLRAFGIAGGSRAMSPRQMERELPPAFKALKASGAAFIHYKICSTFDSSPTVGSIGKAIELGREIFGRRITPLVVGAPVLGRYVVFGNLFARSGLDTEPSRLDRHPTMSRHPVTPMDEADVRLHLARQTKLPTALVDILKLEIACGRKGGGQELEDELTTLAASKPAPIVLFDTLPEAHLKVIGRLISNRRPRGSQLFCVGSSGVEYALVAYWREMGRIAPTAETRQPSATTLDQIITVSGSCSPVTDRQIGMAVKHEFVEIACDSELLADPKGVKQAAADALARARTALDAGRNVIFQTARGPADPRRAAFERAAKRCPGRTRAEKLATAGERLGQGLAFILQEALRTTNARRAIVCGGDTSTAVA
ncbi:MAG: four-carbon acid sugar kinase family protein, partial [Limisphaerales bacterium]